MTTPVRIRDDDMLKLKRLKLEAEERGVRGLSLTDWIHRAVKLLVYEETIRPVGKDEQS